MGGMRNLSRRAAAASSSPLFWDRPAFGNRNFVAVKDGPANLTFGVVRRQIAGGPKQNVPSTIFRRLHPGGSAKIEEPWHPTCYRWDVLLPPHASDEYLDPERLCRTYEAQAFSDLQDLVVMATLRFPNADRLHTTWEDLRAFARNRLCEQRSLAVVAAMHLPIQVGSTNPPHIYLMALARELKGYGFAKFVRPLASDKGKAILADELLQDLPGLWPN